jgi:Leucine-rich repeat (LRR) protein
VAFWAGGPVNRKGLAVDKGPACKRHRPQLEGTRTAGISAVGRVINPAMVSRRNTMTRSRWLVTGFMLLLAGCSGRHWPNNESLVTSKTECTEAGQEEEQAAQAVEKLNGTIHRCNEDVRGSSVIGVILRYNHTPPISDTDLKVLVAFKHLQFLYLDDTRVTDAGLKELAVHTQLNALVLNGTRVTDVGLKELAPLKALKMLCLENTRVTDAGLKELSVLTNLRSLALGWTQVTDTGLKELAGLTKLEQLYLDGTQVTDTGLKEIAGLTQLEWLHLIGTKVTDVGLKELAGLKKLYTLDIRNTQATDAGVKELKAALPKCHIQGPVETVDK